MSRFGATLLREGTEAHYRDAGYYDRTYRRRRHDVAFYVDLARRVGGPVLELGAGSGRVALEIAKAGIDVVAVDRMPEMLARAQERAAALPARDRAHLTLRRGDLFTLRLKRTFPLVIAPFNVLMHLYTRREFERAFATVHAHLSRSGQFAFDVLLPDAHALARDPTRTYRGRPVKLDDGTTYRYSESFHYDPVSQVQLVEMIFEHPRDAAKSFVTPLAHRQIFPAELETMLHASRFDVTGRYGDFARGPLSATSESQVVVARAATRRAAP